MQIPRNPVDFEESRIDIIFAMSAVTGIPQILQGIMQILPWIRFGSKLPVIAGMLLPDTRQSAYRR